ncbi:hypothetical protein C2845_PM13G08540 [Panicum miliaceum]|uniref:Uncharacterized protein n=1 Tax=Panicum miliaceum TaxID=4540 RepID=A0A3L6RH58_PANMI|nr:hypothetical protein C2845_PM13G08540 [Panicum miliaceum]
MSKVPSTIFSVRTAVKNIDPSEAMRRVEKSVASNVIENPSAQTVAKSLIPGEGTPIVEKSGTKTAASKATRGVSQTNRNYISKHQLMNAATKRAWTRSQKI